MTTESKAAILADTSKFQRACSNFVGRNVIYCVSGLIYELREVAEKLDDYDTYLTLTGGRPDYEEAARYFIMEEADLDQLEAIAEENGFWSDVLEEVGYEAYCENFIESRYQDSDEPMELSEWLATGHNAEDRTLRHKVFEITASSSDGFEWVCNEYSLDPDYMEVYEHWIVDGYFGARLKERGEIVEEYLGLTIWGRTCTGQAISIDGVIEEMVRDLDDDHWVFAEER